MLSLQLTKLQDLEARLNYVFTDISELNAHLTSYCYYFLPQILENHAYDEIQSRNPRPLISELCVRKKKYNRLLYQVVTNLSVKLNDADRAIIYKKMSQGDKTLLLFSEYFSLNNLSLLKEEHPLYSMLSINLALFILNAIFCDSQTKKEFNLVDWLMPVLEPIYKESIQGLEFETTRNFGQVFYADFEFKDAEKSREYNIEEYRETFESQILNFSLSNIKQPLPLQKIEPAFDIDDPDGTKKYFNQFIPCILESTRAEIESQYVFLKKQDRPSFFKIKLSQTLPVEDTDATLIQLAFETETKYLPRLDHAFTMEALVLEQYFIGGHQAKKGYELLAIANLHHVDYKKQITHLRIKILKKVMEEKPELFKPGVTWKAFWLAGLMSQSRMYDACLFKCNVPFLQQIVTGRLTEWPTVKAISKLQALSIKQELNPSQLSAVMRFHQAQEGLYCLQGPPGTGKTTTITYLLTLLAKNPDKKIMVCAPANKAVHVIAIRARKLLPEVDMVLTGIGKELPDELKEIYASEQGKYIVNNLSNLRNQLNEFHLMLMNEVNKGNEINEKQKKKFTNLTKSLMTDLSKNGNLWEKLRSSSFFPLDKPALDSISRLEYLEYELSCYLNVYYSTITEGVETETIGVAEIEQIYSNFLYSLNTYLDEIDKTDAIEILLLQHSQIIFCTLVASGRKNLNKYIGKIDILIVDEAAQALEPETLIPLKFMPDKLILIGDPKQLPATIKSKACEAHNYQQSMMARLMEDCRQPYEMLDMQYRMHPTICQWPSITYYSGKLKTAPGLFKRSSPLEEIAIPEYFKQPCVLFNVKSNENRYTNKGQSINNELEAEAIIDILCQCLRYIEGYQIGVIAFYAAQVELLREKVGKKSGALAKKIAQTHIGTVDAFQGEEKDFIILATTRTSESVGFLRDQRRINVASSRARHGFFVVANSSILKSKSDLADWCNKCNVVADYIPSSKQGCIGTISIREEKKEPLLFSDRRSGSHIQRIVPEQADNTFPIPEGRKLKQ